MEKNSKWYIGFQLCFCVAILVYLTEWRAVADTFTTGVLFFVVLMTLIHCGAILEHRKWVFYLEFIRIVSIAGLISYLIPSIVTFSIASVVLFLFIYYFSTLKRIYFNYVYGPLFLQREREVDYSYQ